MFAEAYDQLKLAGIHPRGRYHKEGVKVIRQLLKEEPISEEETNCRPSKDSI